MWPSTFELRDTCQTSFLFCQVCQHEFSSWFFACNFFPSCLLPIMKTVFSLMWYPVINFCILILNGKQWLVPESSVWQVWGHNDCHLNKKKQMMLEAGPASIFLPSHSKATSAREEQVLPTSLSVRTVLIQSKRWQGFVLFTQTGFSVKESAAQNEFIRVERRTNGAWHSKRGSNWSEREGRS